MHDLMNVTNAKIMEVIDEAPALKTFILKPSEPITFLPGQFVLVSRLGIGESAFAISSDPLNTDTISISVQAVGKHTDSLHELDPGDIVSIRGPYGNAFPIDEWRGKDILIAGGGIGIAPLRPVIYSMLSNHSDYASVTVVCGARSPELIPYKRELKEWESKMSVFITVDNMDENWTGKVGVVPLIIEEIRISPENAIAVICGPPIMIKFGREALAGLGFACDQIYTTLEMKMKCGVGICGRCNIDHRYICRDGPVFRMDTIGNY
ncbi:MAG: FAD/NAD(P)-binding protein [Candidatus Aegiribacteria sp.]|nr:FAD/NAD(P)-binding protein [Candidatus Aegiribacteria sp.]